MKPLVLVGLILAALAVGCSDDGDSPTSPSNNNNNNTTDTVSFSSDISPILSSRGCLGSGCHGTPGGSGGLTMGSGSYAAVINASGDNGDIIVPGNANTSNLYLKVTASPPFGSRMPLSGTPLTDDQINSIRDWINQGALDN